MVDFNTEVSKLWPVSCVLWPATTY